MNRSTRFVLGTAGHIDHGKTSLVRALTGIDTDRWKEEKERGITIDLGFARLPLDDGTDVAIVDVPGHEAFVRNMLAGASGLDAALVVIAADEGPMPQTLEHLAILDLMGITRGVVALTKCDLVEDDWLELVEAEVSQLLEGTTLAGSPIVSVSSVGDPGVGVLVAALGELADEVEPRTADDLFRMPIDRAFSVRGTGTVVTGTIWSGRAKVGDTVWVTPGERESRIRRIHAFGEEVSEAVAGSRAALALTGIEKTEAPRGCNVTNAAWWKPTRLFTARIRTLAGMAPIVADQRVRVHVGTAEVMARIHPFGTDVGSSMDTMWAEVRLENSVLVRGADRFVIRSYSPMTTIGGGVVLEPFPPTRRMRSTDPATLFAAAGNPDRRLEHALAVAGDGGMSPRGLSLWVGQTVTPDQIRTAEAEDRAVVIGPKVFSRVAFTRLRDAVLQSVSLAHAERPLDPGAPVETLRALDEGGAVLVQGVLTSLAAEGVITVEAGWVRETGYESTPSAAQQQVLDALRHKLTTAGLEAPRVDELDEEFGDLGPGQDLSAYISYLVRNGEATRLPGDFVAATASIQEAADNIRKTFGGQEGLGPADFREVLPVSRRHLVPILSHMDVLGVTVRRTNVRDVPP